MRSINSTILAQLQNDEFRPFFLFDMEIDSTHYRYTDCDVPIVLDSVTYSPRGLNFDPISYSAGTIVNRARVTLDNLDQIFTALFVGSTVQGSDASLSLVVTDSSGSVLGPAKVTLFQGTIDSWQLDETQVTIEITSVLNRWTQKTIMAHPASCRWRKFKGTECGYSGSATWCDRSYARCAALGNTANFGGNRWLPALVDKELWWGRTQK